VVEYQDSRGGSCLLNLRICIERIAVWIEDRWRCKCKIDEVLRRSYVGGR